MSEVRLPTAMLACVLAGLQPAQFLMRARADVETAGRAVGAVETLGASESEVQIGLPPELPSDNVCGVNSLFMLLLMWGERRSPDDVDRATFRDERGTSMEQLCEAARGLGVEAKAYQCEVNDLGTKCVVPAIALLRAEARTGGIRSGGEGHFVVITGIDPGPNGMVRWRDGTFGDRFQRSKAEFASLWTGFVVSRPLPVGYRSWATQLTLLHGGAWCIAGWYWRRRCVCSAG